MADSAAESARPGSTTNSATASNAASRASTPGATAEKPPDDSSKFKTFLGILRKYVARQAPSACKDAFSNFSPSQVHWCLRSRCRALLPPCAASRASAKLGYVAHNTGRKSRRTQPDGQQSTGTTWTDQTRLSVLATPMTSLGVFWDACDSGSQRIWYDWQFERRKQG